MIPFAVCALIAILGAVGVVLARSPVHSVLALVLNFIALAVLFLSLHSEFMAVIQLIVYAGAIMVLFLFVIGLLTVRKTPVERAETFLASQTPAGIAVGAGMALLLGTGAVLAVRSAATAVPEPFGTTRAFGMELLTTHVLPFELTAFVLMVAVVGVVVLVGRKSP